MGTCMHILDPSHYSLARSKLLTGETERVLSKHMRIADKGWCSSWGIGLGLTTPRSKIWACMKCYMLGMDCGLLWACVWTVGLHKVRRVITVTSDVLRRVLLRGCQFLATVKFIQKRSVCGWPFEDINRYLFVPHIKTAHFLYKDKRLVLFEQHS